MKVSALALKFNIFVDSKSSLLKQLYKIYLEKGIRKSELEMEDRQKMQKTQMEIQILEHQLKVGSWFV